MNFLKLCKGKLFFGSELVAADDDTPRCDHCGKSDDDLREYKVYYDNVHVSTEHMCGACSFESRIKGARLIEVL